MQRYEVDLTPILDVTGGEISVEDSIELEPLTVGDETFTFTGPVRFSVTLTNTSAGVVAAGGVEATASTPCSRCLEVFEMPLAGSIEAFYVPRGGRRGIPDEQQVEPIHEGRIDLSPAILTALVVEAPFAPVHSGDCRGICPVCGADRNVEDCRCAPEPPVSPFEKLKDLFPEKDRET